MVQVIEQGDIFGRIGKSMGEGFGEAAETMVKRSDLARGLDRMRSSFEGQNPTGLDIYSKLLTVMSPEQANTMLPFIREDIQARSYTDPRNQSQQVGGGRPQIGGGQPQQAGGQMQQATPIGRQPIDGQSSNEELVKYLNYDPETLTTIEEVQIARQNIPIFSEQEKEARVGEYLQNRARYPNAQAAAERVAKDELFLQKKAQQSLDKRARQIQLREQTSSTLDKEIEKRLGPSARVDLDRVYSRLHDMSEKDVQSGRITPEAAAKKNAKLAEEFVKDRNQLKSLGTQPLLGVAKEEQIKNLTSNKKGYEEVGALDLFVEDLQVENANGPFLANSIAYPLNDEIASYINKSNLKTKKFLRDQSLGLILADEKVEKTSRKVAEDIIKDIDPSQSIYTMAMAFNQNGLDETILYDTLSKASENGTFEPTKRQERELADKQKVTYTIGDIFMSAMNGQLGVEEKVPAWEKIRRTFMGKR